jgi:hypothetical protein
MNDDRVYDFGPAEGDPERSAWVKRHGEGPIRISIFSAAEAFERDPRRYALTLPPGVRATNV